MTRLPDPFGEQRRQHGVMEGIFNGEKILMLLRHEDVRRAARDWQSFSSNAPFRVPIPSEEELRRMRQLPIETDPPDHTDYRKIVEPFFIRPKDPRVVVKMETLVGRMLDAAITKGAIDIVNDFALPLQSRALTLLLNVPESEADTWIGWGIHVFHSGDGVTKGMALEEYLRDKFDQATVSPGEDFFSALARATFHGRPLTRDEMMGFGNLTFAGGRDTVIHTVSSAIAYLGENPEALDFLREDPGRIVHASEEFFRVYMPLTQIGRVCPQDTVIHGHTVRAGQRVGLCWASANMDETVFEKPDEVRLGRKPNPHLSFGFGPHLCLGAPHARLLLRTLLRLMCEKVGNIRLTDVKERIERAESYSRPVGFELLRAAFSTRG